jgi:hypothetical protein
MPAAGCASAAGAMAVVAAAPHASPPGNPQANSCTPGVVGGVAGSVGRKGMLRHWGPRQRGNSPREPSADDAAALCGRVCGVAPSVNTTACDNQSPQLASAARGSSVPHANNTTATQKAIRKVAPVCKRFMSHTIPGTTESRQSYRRIHHRAIAFLTMH